MPRRVTWATLAALILLAAGLPADPISRYKNDEPAKLGDHSSILVLRLRVINRTPAKDFYPVFRYQAEPKGETWYSVLWRLDDKLPDDAKGNSDVVMYAKAVPGRYDLRGYSFDYLRFTNYLDFHRTMVIPPDSLIVGQVAMDITAYSESPNYFSFNTSFAMDDSVRQDLLARFAAKFPATASQFKGRETKLNSFPLEPWPAPTTIYQHDFARGAGEWPLADDLGRAITCDDNGYTISGNAEKRAAAWASLPLDGLGGYYSIELTTRWLSGATGGMYGVIIGKDTVTYCMWGITGAGEAGIYESFKPLGSKPSFSSVGPRLSVPAIAARGAGDNVITVQVRGEEVTWFVNGRLAKRYKVWSQNIRSNTVGLYVYGAQRVAFKSLKLAKW